MCFNSIIYKGIAKVSLGINTAAEYSAAVFIYAFSDASILAPQLGQ